MLSHFTSCLFCYTYARFVMGCYVVSFCLDIDELAYPLYARADHLQVAYALAIDSSCFYV